MTDRKRYQPPDELVTHVTAICGDAGVAWLADLPLTVAMLEEKWGVTTKAAFEKGEYNFVAPARSESVDAVLKVSPPYPTIEIFAEAEFLRNLNGKGAARLLEVDAVNRAILIERIRPGVTMDVHFADDPFACVEPAIKVLKSILARPPYPPAEAQLFYDWHYRFQRALDSEFPYEYANKALTIFDRFFQDDGRTFHLHGDFHPGNVISSGEEDFVVIDPKGLVGHVAYDISVFLNNLHWWQKRMDGIQERLFQAARQFGDAFGMDERTIREAAYAGMVIGAWWNFEDMPELYNNEVVLADIWDV
ncbi:MAG: aminoglycoside phosphotransferase family protein [Pyrinomonadaceae bacterium]